jgi:hypothetical protein
VKEKRFHNWLAGARDWAVPPPLLLSSELGTYKTVTARFWLSLSGKFLFKNNYCLFARCERKVLPHRFVLF